MSEVTVDGLRKRAMEVCPSDDVLKKCLQGATYVELEDAMQLQYEIGEGKCIQIALDPDDPTTPDVVNTKRIWMKSIVHCQKMDED